MHFEIKHVFVCQTLVIMISVCRETRTDLLIKAIGFLKSETLMKLLTEPNVFSAWKLTL